MYCTNCGFKYAPDSKICINCGSLTPSQKHYMDDIDGFIFPKIDVIQVLYASVVFCKSRFRELAGLSFFVFLSYMCLALNELFTGYEPLFIFIFIVYFSTLIIIGPRLIMAFPFMINALIDGNKVTIPQAYRQSYGKYWLWLGRFGLLSLPMVIPILFQIPLHLAFTLGTVIGCFVHAFFYMFCPMISIEPVTKNYLINSYKMINGNYKSALILILIKAIPIHLINLSRIYVFEGNTAATFTIGVIIAVIYFFVYPLMETIEVIVYKQLKGSLMDSKTHDEN